MKQTTAERRQADMAKALESLEDAMYKLDELEQEISSTLDNVPENLIDSPQGTALQELAEFLNENSGRVSYAFEELSCINMDYRNAAAQAA